MLLRYLHLLETKTTVLSILFLLLACVGDGGGNSGTFVTASTTTHIANNQNANTRNYSRSGRDITAYGVSSSSSGGSSSAVFRALISASLTDSNNRLQSAAALAAEDSGLQMSLVSSPITTASLTANNIFLGPSLSLTSSSAASATSGAGSLLQSASLAGGAGSSNSGGSVSSSGRSSRQNIGAGITNNNVNSHTHGDQLPAQLSSRIIHTRNGAISGVIVQLEGRHLDPVEAYRGIPYASPPVGNLRFMPPVSAAMWSGVKKADR